MATKSLFGEAIRKRPTSRDDAVRAAAARILFDRLPADYLEDSNEDEILEQLQEASRFSTDGYEIARRLESEGWIPDRELVEVLDGGGLYDAEDRAVRAWVKDEGILPSLPLGATLTLTLQGKTGVGEITHIDTGRAVYTVCMPVHGHVKSGLGTHGFCLPFEDVEAMASTERAS